MRQLTTRLLTAGLAVVLMLIMPISSAQPSEPGSWTIAKAALWAKEHPWLVGCNFAPSTAVNQLEMWQAGYV